MATSYTMTQQQLANDEAAFRPVDIDELQPVDYRWFRYSPCAVPCSIFMLLTFTVLLCLTFWQGDFSIKSIRSGIPRDLEPRQGDADGDLGVPEGNQRMRSAAAGIILVLILNQAIVMCTGVKSKIVQIISGVTAGGFLVAGILAIIALALDAGKLDDGDVRECMTQRGAGNSLKCENRKSLMVATVALDGALAVLALAAAGLTGGCGKWLGKTSVMHGVEVNPNEDQAIQGRRAHTARCLITILFTALLLVASLVILFTVLLHDLRERVTGAEWDPVNKQMNSGWPAQNSRIRAAACIAGLILVLLTLVPFPHRVYAYLLGIGFFIVAIVFFVMFAMDISDINSAHDLGCPSTGVDCEYDPYNVTIAFDLLAGISALAFVVTEFIAHKKRSYVQARSPADAEAIDDYDLSGSAFLGASANDQFGKVGAMAPTRGIAGQRPVVGVDVIEMEHPATGELAVAVVSVASGSAAEEANLRVHDVITRWNNAPIHTKADFAAAVRDTPIGATATLQVQRQGGLGLNTAVDYCQLVLRGAPL